jgi:hypothetical protein
MSKENRRLYDRKLIHAYLCTQRPDELERFIGGLIGKLKDKLPGPFKKKAADYICLAFRDLCNPDRDPILLDPERDLRGLFLKHAYRLYIKDSIKLSRERQRFDVENPEQCATLPGRGLTSSLDYGAGQPFPERRWAKPNFPHEFMTRKIKKYRWQ